ncbi:MAG: glucose/mannose transport system permease protein [Candidatus Atribacteria bacterium]|nr:glucose/mannose transport system permease protein [Candidatus Atribacteria bacterium]MDI3531479.1 glucose/mannose transport system permease protein [Candidatus Atribacteria bacterium]
MKDRTFVLTITVLLCVMVFLWMIPIYAMISTSLKTQEEVALQKYLVPPQKLQTSNYAKAFEALKIGLRNSLIISLSATFVCILIGSMAGYALTGFNFRFATYLFFAIVVVTFLPYHVILIPITQFLKTLNLLNTYWGLILIYVILNAPMATLITGTFFMKVPPDLEEAAILDGCKPFKYYLKILLPVSLPGLISATILVFIQIYNEFLLGIALTRGPQVKPVMPFLAELKGTQIAQWHIQMAGAVITSIIPVLVFIFLGRYFISGLMAGYGKG